MIGEESRFHLRSPQETRNSCRVALPQQRLPGTQSHGHGQSHRPSLTPPARFPADSPSKSILADSASALKARASLRDRFTPAVCDSREGMAEQDSASGQFKFLGLRRMRPGRNPVGHGLLLGKARAQRDERGAHGALSFSVCLPGHGARDAAPPRAPDSRGNANHAAGRGLRHSHPVSFAISRSGADHGEPCLAHGGRHAGAAGRGCRAFCRRAARLDRLAGSLRIHGRRSHGGSGRRPRNHGPRNAHARRRPAGDCFAHRRPGLDSAQQKAAANAQRSGGHRVHHLFGHVDAGGLESGLVAARAAHAPEG